MQQYVTLTQAIINRLRMLCHLRVAGSLRNWSGNRLWSARVVITRGPLLGAQLSKSRFGVRRCLDEPLALKERCGNFELANYRENVCFPHAFEFRVIAERQAALGRGRKDDQPPYAIG